MSNETAKCNDQPATERSCPDPAGSISWQRWEKTVTYKWTFGDYSITKESDTWALRYRNNFLFGDQDLQVVQEWAASYIKSNVELYHGVKRGARNGIDTSDWFAPSLGQPPCALQVPV